MIAWHEQRVPQPSTLALAATKLPSSRGEMGEQVHHCEERIFNINACFHIVSTIFNIKILNPLTNRQLTAPKIL